MERRAWCFLGTALSCLFLTTAGWTQTSCEDPQGRFVIDLPEGWNNLPFKPAPGTSSAEAAISASPGQTSAADLQISYGDSRKREKNFKAAIQNYSEAIKLDPRAAEAYFKRSWIYLRWGDRSDLDKAVTDASKAIELDPAFKLAHFVRGRAYLYIARIAKDAQMPKEAAGLFDRALADLTRAQGADFKAVKRFPDYKDFEFDPALELLVDIGHAHFGKGELDRALTAYSSAYERASDSDRYSIDDSLSALFLEYRRQNRTFDVGDAPQTLHLLGRDLSKSDPDQAIRHLTRALTLSQDKYFTMNVHESRSVAYANKGDFVSAIADADNVIKIYDFYSSFENRADIYVKWGKYDKAISDYSEAIKIKKKSLKKAVSYDEWDLKMLYDLYHKRGVAHIENGSLDKGIADILEAEKDLTGPGKADLYRHVASIYQLKGDAKSANKYLRKAEAQESKVNK